MNLLMKGPILEDRENDVLLMDHVSLAADLLAAAAMTPTDQIVET